MPPERTYSILLHPVAAQSLPLRLYRRFGKRCLDVLGAAVLLVLLLPALVAIGLGVRLFLGSPILYRQRRIGIGTREFTLVKFRTMRPETPLADGARPADSNPDSRHTPFGRFLRRWSLDELPQLLQVLRGELSLVGPRPELVSRLDGYSAEERERFSVRPGLSGLWQVTARHCSDHLHDHVELDLAYVRNYSLGNDLRILLETPRAAIKYPAPQ